MRVITVVIENPSDDEIKDFSERLLKGNVAHLSIGNVPGKYDIAERDLRELEHDETACEAIEKIDAMDLADASFD